MELAQASDLIAQNASCCIILHPTINCAILRIQLYPMDYIHTYKHMYICMYTHKHIYTHVYIYLNMYIMYD